MEKRKEKVKEYRTVKKSKRIAAPRANHKHIWETIVMSKPCFRDHQLDVVTKYCTVCGKIPRQVISFMFLFNDEEKEEYKKLPYYISPVEYPTDIKQLRKTIK